jgi:hypothetical protein
LRKTYCVVCAKQRKGIEVDDDAVLESIRWIKKNITKNEKGNRIVVCRDCYSAYKASRSRYEGRQRIYVALGVLFAVLSLFISPALSTLGVSVGILTMMVLLSLLSYTPKISIKTAQS